MSKEDSGGRMYSAHSKMPAGLSKAEIAAKQRASGYNELPKDRSKGLFSLVLSIFRDPMFLMLLVLGLAYYMLGEPKDAQIFLALTVCLIFLTIYQQRKTEKALAALKRISAPQAIVMRGGKRMAIDSRYLVVGDIVIIEEGGMVPADGELLSELNLLINESILTGESAPVGKIVWDGREKLSAAGGDSLPFVFSGTTVLRGRGVFRVTAIGIETEIGKIGRSLAEIKESPTLIESEVGFLIKWFALYGLTVCLAVILLFGFIKNDWLQGLLSGLSLAMAVLPEELSVILAVFMALGAWRLAKSKALAKKGSAIETLGAVSVLCVDKTGTITKNQSVLEALVAGGKEYRLTSGARIILPGAAINLLQASFLACAEHSHDPLENEIKAKAVSLRAFKKSGLAKMKHLREYPMSKELLAMTNVWDIGGGAIEVAAKGAPEAIAELCRMSAADKKFMKKEITSMAANGLRVLAAARAIQPSSRLPRDHRSFRFEYLGLIGFSDPIRSQVPAAVNECHMAGIRVIMITGDYPQTAQYIAKRIGLNNPNDCITGDQLKLMKKAELRNRIKYTDIFARVLPEQKLAIVEALRANREVVAMTGDGVNDAPALKAAHIGIAMGERGTDVARETADLVLLNDDFSTIVKAIRMGRRIFDNIRKATSFVFAIHFPIAGMTLLPLISGMPVFFLPIHIAFLELIIDPACSLVFETEEAEKGIMERPPRLLNERLMDRKTLVRSLVQGVGVLAIVFGAYVLSLNRGLSADAARTVAFIALSLSNIFLIIANLSYLPRLRHVIKEKNAPLLIVSILSVLILVAAILFEPLRNVFQFSLIDWRGLLFALAAAGIAAFWLEGLKAILPKTANYSG